MLAENYGGYRRRGSRIFVGRVEPHPADSDRLLLAAAESLERLAHAAIAVAFPGIGQKALHHRAKLLRFLVKLPLEKIGIAAHGQIAVDGSQRDVGQRKGQGQL